MEGAAVAVQRLEHDVGGAVAELAVGDVPVFDRDDGVVDAVVRKVVHDDFTVRPELLGNPPGELAQEGQRGGVQHGGSSFVETGLIPS